MNFRFLLEAPKLSHKNSNPKKSTILIVGKMAPMHVDTQQFRSLSTLGYKFRLDASKRCVNGRNCERFPTIHVAPSIGDVRKVGIDLLDFLSSFTGFFRFYLAYIFILETDAFKIKKISLHQASK